MTGAAGRPPFAHYRELLARAGFRPSRRRGQNFLLDPTLHAWIAEAAGVGEEDLVVEVGAGLGFLTRELARRAARVVAVEVDARLERILQAEREDWGEAGARVRVCWMDALRGGRWNPLLLEVLAEEAEVHRGPLRFVANLPYAVAGPLLAGLPLLPRPPEGGAVLLQEEMARRVAAAPGGADYGGLSVVLQSVYRVALARRVGRDVFWPRPAVGSAVVVLGRREDSPVPAWPVEERARFARFARALFGQRRKKLANVLPGALRTAGGPAAVDLPAGWGELRPGVLSWDQVVRIWTEDPGLS